MLIRLLYFCFRIYCFIFRPVRMGVRVLMIQDGKVWLVRQTYMPGWFMPGGGVKRNETLEQAVRREAREETGAELGAITLMGAYTNFTEWKTDHNAVFLCADFQMKGKPDAEIAELRAFPLSELPDDLWPGHHRRLQEYQAGVTNPQFGEW
ncbi:MAG: NUDIX domain-containing protein [Chloroflexi bacterium]|nr:NUDIX domain-containing protein [Chloroflexota bacterium]